MLFNSYGYILAFIPIVTVLYYMINRLGEKVGKCFLLIASLFFYIISGFDLFLIVLLLAIGNLVFAYLIKQKKHTLSKLIITVAISSNILILFIYKYLDFSIIQLNGLFKTNIPNISIIAPLGISFIVFQEIAYLVSVKNGEIEQINVLDYALYIFFFPKIMMGPLMEPVDFISQINNAGLKKVDWNNVASGINIFCYGLFKKVVLAETFSLAVNWAYENFDEVHALEWILISVFYTFEIYFDFSGYTDMATGSALMLNIWLPINFDSPYKACSIREFWKRWHISLTAFFTKYIYIPLGGNKRGNFATYANILLVFLISGIWHGANYTFILWGVIYGVLMVFERIASKNLVRIPKWISFIYTFGMIDFLWLLFRSNSVKQWLTIVGIIIQHENTKLSDRFLNLFWKNETYVLSQVLHITRITDIKGAWMIIYIVVATVICFFAKNYYRATKRINALSMVASALALCWCLISLSSESTFIYLNF